jgi:hypothetical protein
MLSEKDFISTIKAVTHDVLYPMIEEKIKNEVYGQVRAEALRLVQDEVGSMIRNRIIRQISETVTIKVEVA